MSIDAREIARQIITEHATDIEYGSIGDVLSGKDETKELPETEFEELQEEIDGLIGLSSTTITLPGDRVCPECGGTGQPGEDDGTPKDLPQWEDLRALLAEHRDSPLTDGELADKVMALFGGEA